MIYNHNPLINTERPQINDYLQPGLFGFNAHNKSLNRLKEVDTNETDEQNHALFIGIGLAVGRIRRLYEQDAQ